MKYLIIGLGNFGSSMAVELSQLGHEVVGVDCLEHKIAGVKDFIASAVQLDATEVISLRMLPLKDMDVVVVAVGTNFGASVQIVALLKQEKVKTIFARAISDIHAAVLESLSVDRILTPEKDAAKLLCSTMEFKGFESSLKVDEDHFVIKFITPAKFVGKTLKDINLESKFNLLILTVSETIGRTNLFGKIVSKHKVIQEPVQGYILKDNDVIVAYGLYNDFQELLEIMR